VLTLGLTAAQFAALSAEWQLYTQARAARGEPLPLDVVVRPLKAIFHPKASSVKGRIRHFRHAVADAPRGGDPGSPHVIAMDGTA